MVSKGICYYTDNRLDPFLMQTCQKQLLKSGLKIVSCSLQTMEFGENIVLPLQRGILTLFKQMLTTIEKIGTEIIFFCEHDVLYSLTHFDFIPEKKDIFYYNTNVYRVLYPSGHVIWTDNLEQVSGICVYKTFALDYYKKKVEQLEQGNFDKHYEPNPREDWQSKFPNIDIRHTNNLTHTKLSPDEFRNKKYAKGWKEQNFVPNWGTTEGRLLNFLQEI
jgi:hypothetical protein